VMTPEAMAFFVQHTTGIVCAGVKGEILDRLQIPLMVPDKDNEEALLTAFTVTVDVKAGTSTGVSAKDRCLTVKALASSDSKPNHFRRPGHVFPLRYREGGVLKRAGHTEASVDLAVMAGFAPVGVLCELVNKDGSMSRLPDLQKFAKAYDCPLISIADLIRYKRKRAKLVTRTAVARLPTTWGSFQASHCMLGSQCPCTCGPPSPSPAPPPLGVAGRGGETLHRSCAGPQGTATRPSDLQGTARLPKRACQLGDQCRSVMPPDAQGYTRDTMARTERPTPAERPEHP
jgi:3,4-dihydroxy-2-butanone 4-phosphate synthase